LRCGPQDPVIAFAALPSEQQRALWVCMMHEQADMMRYSAQLTILGIDSYESLGLRESGERALHVAADEWVAAQG
jgi:hypothetical protein